MEGRRGARVEPHGLIVVGDGAVELAFAQVDPGAVGEGRCLLRIELHRLVEVLQGAVELLLLPPGVATVAEGGGVVRLKLDGLVVVLDGAIPVALAGVGDAAIVVGGGARWIELDRPIVILDGAVEVALALMGGRANDVDRRKIPPGVAARLDQGRAAADYGIERHIALAVAGVDLLLVWACREPPQSVAVIIAVPAAAARSVKRMCSAPERVPRQDLD